MTHMRVQIYSQTLLGIPSKFGNVLLPLIAQAPPIAAITASLYKASTSTVLTVPVTFRSGVLISPDTAMLGWVKVLQSVETVRDAAR